MTGCIRLSSRIHDWYKLQLPWCHLFEKKDIFQKFTAVLHRHKENKYRMSFFSAYTTRCCVKFWMTSEDIHFVVLRLNSKISSLHSWHPLWLRGMIKFLWLHYNWNARPMYNILITQILILISLTSQNFPSRPQSNGFIKSKQTLANWEIPGLSIIIIPGLARVSKPCLMQSYSKFGRGNNPRASLNSTIL